jgi:hypothetical protein
MKAYHKQMLDPLNPNGYLKGGKKWLKVFLI